MLIASYNLKALGDVLLILTAPASQEQIVKKQGNVIRIENANGELLGVNFLAASEIIDLTGLNGSIQLSAEQVTKLNATMEAAGFPGDLVADLEPKFVVGYVEKTEPHPDSDHLKITTTLIDNDQRLQIVSGSPNMQADIKVVVAKVGAMMPSGLIIWPGELRGVASNGMIVSGRELMLPNAPQVPGALILPNDFAPVGSVFDRTTSAAQAIFE
ncbi:phenylalanyl-tRNA synthetase beta subunit [Weissella oryzae SG25]|uniref:Phenylalanyl-tRNA synthetase beta subunit n=1 Tax=Weissella oryzae (strain DSM 25784 / JCM 18191 / LMG 30913 / SG25) TaxID=1329250 RepID=A0A069D143_WEIOS|nr:DUF4479 and tRNA-binding domain-containing protein [Weissella oryzae]GAK31081.1 phenylalanyl-tRNA synthetase beta subunit [Weissella oryzae SG25]